MPLAQSYTLIIPDLPGHGQSPAQGRATAARDGQLIANLLADGAHLVGLSYGGSVALQAAALRPTAVRSLVLVEPNTFDISAGDPDVRQMLGELMQAVAIADPRERLQASMNVIGVQRTLSDPLTETERTIAADLQSIAAQYPNSRSTRQLAETLIAAGVRSLIISGGHRLAWERHCDIMAAVLNAQRATIPGFGHVPHQSGEPFNRLITNFWSESA